MRLRAMIAAAAVPLALAACSTAQDVGSSIGNTFSDGARVIGHGFRDVFTLARDDLEVLQQTQPRGTQFARALAEGYTGLAESERQQYDWVSSDRFAEKGLKAAQGTIVPPENPEDWGLNRNVRGEVAQTRQRLVNAISAGSGTMPALAAKAQVSYDCWVEQLDEGWQTEHIAACRRNMMAALEGLERGGRQTAAAQPAPQAADTRGPERYLVFFDWDKSDLSSTAQQVVGDAARAVTRRNLDVIVVEGHADRSGSDDYNVRLSQRRADAVRQALVAQGIPANRIQTQAYGESQPLVQTEDGVRNAQNRRSSVIIETGPVAATPVERAPMDGAPPRLPGEG